MEWRWGKTPATFFRQIMHLPVEAVLVAVYMYDQRGDICSLSMGVMRQCWMEACVFVQQTQMQKHKMDLGIY
jgi:hypothetical protein